MIIFNIIGTLLDINHRLEKLLLLYSIQCINSEDCFQIEILLKCMFILGTKICLDTEIFLFLDRKILTNSPVKVIIGVIDT